MSINKSDVKVGNSISTGVRTYEITHELDSDWVAYTYLAYNEKRWGASKKTDFVDRGYELILPFFEKGSSYVYKYDGSTVYTVEHVTEKEGVKVALVWYRSEYSKEVQWTYFDQSEYTSYKLSN